MSRLRARVLVRECVKAMLAEDEAGSIAGDMMFGAGVPDLGYGNHFGSGEDLYKIFVKPFTDVVGVAAGKGKEASQKLQTLLHVAFETVATTVVPVLSSDYGEIFSKEKQRIDKIRTEYADVYQATWDAFNDHDVLVASFMYNPTAFLTSKFVEHAPGVAFKLMSVLSGGTIDQELGSIKSSVSKKKAGKHEGVIREDGEQQDDQRSAVAQALTNKDLLAKLSQSQKVQEMEREGQEMVRDTLTTVFKHASGVMKARSIADLQKVAKKPIPGLDKLKEVPEQERQQAEQQLLKGVKDSMRAFYVKSLEAQVKDAVDAGTPQNHPFVRDYMSVIAKVKSL